MPQMGPLMWFMMMNITIATLMILSSINYFTQKPIPTTTMKINLPQSNWKW